MMGEKQGEVKTGHEIEKESARDKTILGRDQINDERADADNGLPQANAMFLQQVGSQRVIARAVASEILEGQSQHQQNTIDAIATPGQMPARRIEIYHQPYTQPEKSGGKADLTD